MNLAILLSHSPMSRFGFHHYGEIYRSLCASKKHSCQLCYGAEKHHPDTPNFHEKNLYCWTVVMVKSMPTNYRKEFRTLEDPEHNLCRNVPKRILHNVRRFHSICFSALSRIFGKVTKIFENKLESTQKHRQRFLYIE